MVTKIRFEEVRASRRRRTPPSTISLLDPRDAALIGAAILLATWLQCIYLAS